jgi:hypothetical protein
MSPHFAVGRCYKEQLAVLPADVEMRPTFLLAKYLTRIFCAKIERNDLVAIAVWYVWWARRQAMHGETIQPPARMGRRRVSSGMDERRRRVSPGIDGRSQQRSK